jgi:hypothetical protein
MAMLNKTNSRLGSYVLKTFGGESFRAFVPSRLLLEPPLALQALLPLLEQANQALGRLDGLASSFPDRSLFIYGVIEAGRRSASESRDRRGDIRFRPMASHKCGGGRMACPQTSLVFLHRA